MYYCVCVPEKDTFRNARSLTSKKHAKSVVRVVMIICCSIITMVFHVWRAFESRHVRVCVCDDLNECTRGHVDGDTRVRVNNRKTYWNVISCSAPRRTDVFSDKECPRKIFKFTRCVRVIKFDDVKSFAVRGLRVPGRSSSPSRVLEIFTRSL